MIATELSTATPEINNTSPVSRSSNLFPGQERQSPGFIRIISKSYENPHILDVATGTGDLAIAALRLKPLKITGIDISEKMLEIAREKLLRRGLTEKIELLKGDSEHIDFEDNSFDVAMVAFGVRNYNDPLKGLTEMCRVTKPGGLLLVLEFSKPVSFPFRQIYSFYFLNILPFFGRLFSNLERILWNIKVIK